MTVNPLTGRNQRGFREGVWIARAEKQACREIIEKAVASLGAGYSLVSFRYKPLFHPADTNVELKLNTPQGAATHVVRVPTDSEGRPWGGRIPGVLARFIKRTYT